MPRPLAKALLLLCLAGVGGGACKDNTVTQSSNTTNNFNTIGPEGGIVVLENGTQIEIPPGALRDKITVGIEVTAEPGPPPPNTIQVGPAYDFTPLETELLVDATISLRVPPGVYEVHQKNGFSDWTEFAGSNGQPDATGFIRFKVAKLARFAVFSRSSQYLSKEPLDTQYVDHDLIASSGHVF